MIKLKQEDDLGYILEVDLQYPSELHESHNEYPLAPESIKIDKECLSPYAKDGLKKLGGSCGIAKKLLTTLHHDKTKYVLRKNLELYQSLGLNLRKIN